jgi:hypothetical protein
VVVTTADVDLDFWCPGLSGISSFGPETDERRAGQKDVDDDASTVADLSRIEGRETTSNCSLSHGSSTSGFLLILQNMELDRDGGVRSGDSAAAGAVLSSSLSFFLMNQSPEDLPWTFMVSVASLSIPPGWSAH